MVNSSYKGCISFFIFLLLLPFLIENAEALEIHSNSFGLFNSSDYSNDPLDDNFPVPRNFTFPIQITNTQDSLLIVGLSMRDRNPDIDSVFFNTTENCDPQNADSLTLLPGSQVQDTTRTNVSIDSRIYNITLQTPTIGSYYICVDLGSRISHFMLATAVLFQGFYTSQPFGDVETNHNPPAPTILSFNCIDSGNILFATISNFISRNNDTIGLEEGQILAAQPLFREGGKAAAGVFTNPAGSFTFNFTNTNLQSFAISGVEINGVQPLVGCPVYPDESLGINDKISLSISKTLRENLGISDVLNYDVPLKITKTLSENLGISDSISTKAHYVRNLFDGISISDLLDHNTAAKITKSLSETLSISDFLDYNTRVKITKSLTETIGLLDILDYLPPDPPHPPIVEPEPVQTVTVQKSTGSSGSGRTNVDVSSHTSMDRLTIWLADENYFKIAVRDLISQDLVDLKPSQVKNPPTWFYQTVEFWNTEQISDEEFFAALEFILK